MVDAILAPTDLIAADEAEPRSIEIPYQRFPENLGTGLPILAMDLAKDTNLGRITSHMSLTGNDEIAREILEVTRIGYTRWGASGRISEDSLRDPLRELHVAIKDEKGRIVFKIGMESARPGSYRGSFMSRIMIRNDSLVRLAETRRKQSDILNVYAPANRALIETALAENRSERISILLEGEPLNSIGEGRNNVVEVGSLVSFDSDGNVNKSDYILPAFWLALKTAQHFWGEHRIGFSRIAGIMKPGTFKVVQESGFNVQAEHDFLPNPFVVIDPKTGLKSIDYFRQFPRYWLSLSEEDISNRSDTDIQNYLVELAHNPRKAKKLQLPNVYLPKASDFLNSGAQAMVDRNIV